MLDISLATVEKVIVHQIGNKIREEGYKLSSSEMLISEQTQELLLRHYLPVFAKIDNTHEFYHESDLSLNAVKKFSQSAFIDRDNFVDFTQSIAKQLYSSSTHPNISKGEFIVVLFNDLKVNGEKSYALGLYKTETKDDFFDIEEKAGVLQLTCHSGISLQRIQKGALVLEKNNQVLVVDTLSQKTKYWIDSFLKVTHIVTQKSAAKHAATIIKAIASEIPDPSTSISFSHELEAVAKVDNDVSIGDIKSLSEKYVTPEIFESILTGINESTTSPITDIQKLDVKVLNKLTQRVIKNSKIIEGVELQVSKPAIITSIEVIKTSSGVRAMIDIEIANGV